MSRAKLSFSSVQIHRLFAFRTGRRQLRLPDEGDKFTGGLNIVYGPNASGKTTTAVALQTLLWPEAYRMLKASVDGTFKIGDAEWTVEILAGDARYHRNGSESASPSELPPAVCRNRYRLALHELLQAEDRDLAEAIINEINGGLDLAAAAAALGFDDRIPASNIAERRRFVEAQNRAREMRQHQEKLRSEQVRVGRLQEQLTAAREAREEVRFCELLKYCAEVNDRVGRAQATASAFPAAISALDGNEGRELDQLNGDIAAVSRTLSNQQSRAETAEREIQAAGLTAAEEGAARETLASLRALLANALVPAENRRGELLRQREGLAAAVAEARRRLGPQATDQQLEALLLGDEANLREMLREVEDCRRRRGELSALVEAMDTAAVPREEDVRRCDHGLGLLLRWLQSSAAASPRTAPADARRFGTVALAGVAICAALLLGILVHPAWFFSALLPAGILAIWWAVAGQAATGRSAVAEIENEYALTGLPQPTAWSEGDVRLTCSRLHDELAQLRLAQVKEEYRRARMADAERLTENEQRLNAQLQQLADRFGLSVPDEFRIFLFAENLSRWQAAAGELRRVEAELAEEDQQYRDRLAEFNRLYAISGETASITTAHQAAGLLTVLEERVAKVQKNSHELRDAQDRLREAGSEMSRLQERRLVLLKKVAPELPEAEAPDTDVAAAETSLRALLVDFSTYREAALAQRDAELEKQRAEQAVRSHALFVPASLDMSIAQIEAQMEQAHMAAAEYDNVLAEINQIGGLVKAAKNRHDLEEALAEFEEAKRGLTEEASRTVNAMAGKRLLEFLRQRAGKSASGTLNKAQQNFRNITAERYQLSVADRESGVFEVRDNVLGITQPLSELSSATRVQLLLAARLAFVEQQEQSGPKLPLLLDELLGNSDDARAHAIMEAVLGIVEEGRQVFYFTAQHDEVAKWQDACRKRQKMGAPDVYRLPVLGEAAAVAELADFSRSSGIDDSVPEPGASSHEEYGRQLRPAKIDPYSRHMGQLHLWHVVDDCAVLWRLLQLRYRTWGQLQSLVEAGGEKVLAELGITDNPDFFASVGTRVRVLSRAVELWRIGRGQPVTAAVIQESVVGTSKFASAIAALATACHGDAAELLQRLEEKAVKGVGPTLIDKLRDYLAENQFADPRERLDELTIIGRLDAMFAPDVAGDRVSAEDIRRLAAKVIDQA
jgi:energy-coupling factor transporter ATP-binding protein EcfA2